jgi:hypothetical protein
VLIDGLGVPASKNEEGGEYDLSCKTGVQMRRHEVKTALN